MERLELRDFSGGISEQYAPEGFSERQWSKLKGFVIDTDYSIRSQWAAQSIGSIGNVMAVHGFRGNDASYLVAIKENGQIWWAEAPGNSAAYTTTNATVWTRLTEDKDEVEIQSDVYYRFICEILLTVEGVGEVNALLLNSTAGEENAVAIYENDAYDPSTMPLSKRVSAEQWDRRYPVDQPNLIDPLVGEKNTAETATTAAMSFTATDAWQTFEYGATKFRGGTTTTQPGTRWTVANDGDYAIQLRVARIGTGSEINPEESTYITAVYSKDSYTHTSALVYDSGESEFNVLQVRIAPSEVTEHGSSIQSSTRVGITLGTYPLARRNVMPRANVGIMWRNRLILGDIKKRWNPAASWEASGNQKRAKYGLFYSEVEVDSFREQAILYAGSGESQIVGMHVLDDYLITVSSAETEVDGLRVFKGTLDYLRLQNNEVTLNINVLRGGVGPKQELGIATENLSPSCVWPEAGIVVFLDAQGGVWYTDGVEVDRLDRTGPTMPDITTPNDEVAALGKYLFVWRAGRLLVLNILSGIRGESATAAWTELVLPESATSLKSFCPVSGNMYFVMDGEVWRYALSRNNPADNERASYDNVAVTLTVASPTISDQDSHSKVNWFNFGVRARGRTSESTVHQAKMFAGPSLDPSTASYTTSLERQLQDRDELVVKCGIGYRTEGSGQVTFSGDVQIESMSFWTSGVRMSRPNDG